MKGTRIIFLDVLRGFALLGILYAHFVIWFTGSGLPSSAYEVHSDTFSLITFAVLGTRVLGKFFSVFSFLFGASFYFQQETASFGKADGPALVTRFVILITVGFIHHLFWRGDILMIYGILGFGLLLMRKASSGVLLFSAVFFLFNVPGFAVGLTPETVSVPMAEDAERHLWLMKQGSLSDFLRDNLMIFDNKLAFQLESGRFSRTFGFFLLGLYAARQRWFTSEQGSHNIMLTFRITGQLLLMMIVTAAMLFWTDYIRFDGSEKAFKSALPLSAIYDLYNVLLSLFLISGMYRLYTSVRWGRYFNVLYYPGKMAMSVYVMQTVIGLTLFYPFGLHLFTATSPGTNALLVIPVFIFQVFCCRWWLRRFGQGPLEWITRTIVQGDYSNRSPSGYSQPAPEVLGKR